MASGPPLPREELVRLRRAVGLPDTLPHERPDASPAEEGTPRCACNCGCWVRRTSRNGRWPRYLPGHEPDRGGVHRRRS